MIKVDIAGETFGLLKVEERVKAPPGNMGVRYAKSSWWRCRCRCGNTVDKPLVYLKSAAKPHCGCRNGEIRQLRSKIGHDGIRKKTAADASQTSIREQTGKMYGVMRQDKICKQCGRVFDCYAGSDWAWKTGKKDKWRFFCSYGCMRKYTTK